MQNNGIQVANSHRVLVTGSRGKSSIVRMLHAAMSGAGLRAWARITGVLPRELGPGGVRTVLRSSGAHVEEMRWWLRRLPASAQAVILENSAISPDLQGLAGLWLKPGITVFSNALPDHQEAWGPGREDAAAVLVAGIPRGAKVVLPAAARHDRHLANLLGKRRCKPVFAQPYTAAGEAYKAANLGLALAAIECLGLDSDTARETLLTLPGDRFDFQVLRRGGADIAMAFSANDVLSTRLLFDSLRWSEQETRLVYNHRSDRPARLASFSDWLHHSPWKEVLVIGDRPSRRPASSRYLKVRKPQELLALFRPGERVFGCGNIAGLPLALF
ncbi:MAG: Mur ligase family protein [Xanthomonadales bacterium]|nr:Mur ligase family protein [Xanthomonadales bacterium]